MATLNGSKADLWIGGGLLAFCGFAAWRTTYVKTGIASTSAGPAFVPWIMITLLALLSVVLIMRALRRAQGADSGIVMPEPRTLLAMGAFVLVLVCYAAAFMPLGYLPSTLAAFIVGLLLLGERNWLVVLLFPVGMTAAVYLGFTRLLSVWLP